MGAAFCLQEGYTLTAEAPLTLRYSCSRPTAGPTTRPEPRPFTPPSPNGPAFKLTNRRNLISNTRLRD